LQALLAAAEGDGVTITGLATDYTSVVETGHPLFQDHARELIQLTAESMRKLESGHMEVDAPQVQLRGAEIIESLQREGFATALGNLFGFWLPESVSPANHVGADALTPGAGGDPAGGVSQEDIDQAKLNYQRQSIDSVRQRSVPITRVFLLERADVPLPQEFW